MPVLGISSIIMGLHFILLEPNFDDPLNKDAAELYKSNASQFNSTVRSTLRGGNFRNESFTRLL
jgi:ubiquitin-conjugating enzyme E2 M